jgi:hypothetical protein
MGKTKEPKTIKEWKRLYLSEQLERSYCESLNDKLRKKIKNLEGEIQDMSIDMIRKDRIIDLQQSVINDNQ